MLLSSAEVPSFPEGKDRFKEIFNETIHLATPMLGGGSVAGSPDLDQPFRPSSIRGALRRWWRASNSFESPADMREREKALWGMADGDAGTSSAVKIEVTAASIKESALEQLASYDPQSDKVIFATGVPEYAAGVMVPGKKEVRAGEAKHLKILRDGEFKLRVSVRNLDNKEQVERAIFSWILFGGLGSRTRRGFGALTCSKAKLSVSGLKALLALETKMQPAFGFTSLLKCPGTSPAYSPRVMVYQKLVSQEPVECWAKAMYFFQAFRKGQVPDLQKTRVNIFANPWPESSALKENARSTGPFPRAALGLPLSIKTSKDDDKGIAISSTNSRFSSPVSVRPLRLGDAWYPAILIMATGDFDDERFGISTNAKGHPAKLNVKAGGRNEKAVFIDTPKDIFDRTNALTTLLAYLNTQPEPGFWKDILS